ncbi:MAG: uroporphyrinogen-III C-methyltransferase [Acidiferrobacterales bacterium]|nr:uroporphyrinogen-III C-methyltransferase [Acidiferrobacterales bacterium]
MSCTPCVYLVGAGPGDPELLTVKAQRLIQQADVVVYDRLVSPEVLATVPQGVARICVGKGPGNHSTNQQEINQLLASLARHGRRVVRLKGGDPFVFGRGSEEARHLTRHGVAFEVVPGVTAATACAAYAGIPLTHRGLSTHVHLVAGHRRNNEPLDIAWDKLADPQGTIVIYMGLANVAEICAALMAAGLTGNTAVAAIENGTTRAQRRYITTLAELPTKVAATQLAPPVLFVIGKVVALAHELDWFAAADNPRLRADMRGGT